MLTEREATGIKELLEMVKEDDLFSITRTVTNRLIVPENKHEALESILRYTDRPASLLKRKRLRRDIIFQYLDLKRVAVDSSADKFNMVKALLKYWNSEDCEQSIDFEEYSVEEQVANMTYNGNGDSKDRAFSSLQTLGETQQMAIEFCRWFYDIWNRCDTSQDFKPEHFWSDCSLKVCLRSPSNVHMDEIAGNSASVFQKLTELRLVHQILFNPNLCLEGIRGKIEPHGLVSVLACGTLHSVVSQTCCGIFEQFFGLVRDPTGDNNWKVKVTHLQLTSKAISSMPKIVDTDLAALTY